MSTSAIVGTSVPEAVGYAYALKYKDEKGSVICYLGDGATEEGVFWESINFAALKEIPVVFICENNKYSVYSPLDVRQPKKRDISKIVQSMNIELEKVNGSNVLNAYNTIKNSFEYVRKYKKPKFIEITTSKDLSS